ncbi:MAG: hypothetical protein FWF33_02160 [Clostridiales bacterium]|nr:hypothetical protein [Clostridiales bacterium]
MNKPILFYDEKEAVQKIHSDIPAARCAICEKRTGAIHFKGQAICRNCLQELRGF